MSKIFVIVSTLKLNLHLMPNHQERKQLAMTTKNLPEHFAEFSEAKRNGFLRVKEIKDNGGYVAGIFCTFTPREILQAGGIHHVGLCGMSEDTIPYAERDLPKGLCPLIKSSYGYAVSEQCPFMYFSDIVVGETTCDGKKKMYELLSKIKEVYVLQLPQKANDESALMMWSEELHRFRTYIENRFQITITDEQLREASRIQNELRKVKREIMELERLTPPPFAGYDLYQLMDGTGFLFDELAVLAKLRTVLQEIKDRYAAGERPVSAQAKRILITGCPIMAVLDKTVKIIEENGGVVVCYENCGGIKTQRYLIDTEADDIITAIARYYLSIGCAVMSPDLQRINLLRELVDEFQIDAIIEIDLQYCQPYAVETFQIKNLAEELGIRYMNIDTDYSQSDQGQLVTRLCAFLETI